MTALAIGGATDRFAHTGTSARRPPAPAGRPRIAPMKGTPPMSTTSAARAPARPGSPAVSMPTPCRQAFNLESTRLRRPRSADPRSP
ncbi:hypothetical protein HBB16_16310 [Pseudonocardia sp. MCCB 268]|nr:hypothetical protein [Pseudonocardia cytotoxica]